MRGLPRDYIVEDLRREFDPDQPRDDDGKWSGGGGSDPEPVAVKSDATPILNPETIDVGGDQWNKDTAVRLETEYQTARPELEKIATAAVGEHVVATNADGDEEEEEEPFVPDEWSSMGDDQQEEAKQHYLEHNQSEVYDSEVNNWHENGEALHIAKKELANDFDSSDPDLDWAIEAVSDFRVEFEGRIPYTDEQILAAVSVSYDDEDYDGKADPEIEFDDSKLDKPDHNFNPAFTKDQLPLPGIDAPAAKEPHEALTEEMRTELKDALVEAFNKKADSNQSDVEPPDYLKDSAQEYLEESWDQKDDDDKFDYVKNNTQIIENIENEQNTSGSSSDADSGPVEMPTEFDPLQKTGSSKDYQRTQRLANHMSIERQMQVLASRNLGADVERDQVKRIDNALWSGWKASSTNFAGSILQLAAAEEMGGRYRDLATHRTDLIKQANDKYSHIGGFEGIKAMVRAKWETTQYLLDKGNWQTLEVYRGLKIDMSDADRATIEKVETKPEQLGGGYSSTTAYEKISDANIVRNGAMSTTTSKDVANSWNAGSGNTKVVLRIDTPRTSVLSVPAYGINVHSEREVVVMGTSWGSWDAWKDNAPGFGDIPMKAAA